MLDFPAPNPINGDLLEAEILAAGQPPVRVRLTVDGTAAVVTVQPLDGISSLDAATVEAVVAAHTGEP